MNKEPIQKEDVKEVCPECEGVGYIIKTPTTSDTFIEDKVKQFDNHFEAILTYWGAAGIRKDLNQFLKSSLQEQRQSILEEIEKMKTDERKVYYFGKEPNCYGAETYQEKMLVNAVLEDIKQLLK